MDEYLYIREKKKKKVGQEKSVVPKAALLGGDHVPGSSNSIFVLPALKTVSRAPWYIHHPS